VPLVITFPTPRAFFAMLAPPILCLAKLTFLLVARVPQIHTRLQAHPSALQSVPVATSCQMEHLASHALLAPTTLAKLPTRPLLLVSHVLLVATAKSALSLVSLVLRANLQLRTDKLHALSVLQDS